jgi:hypothetical protein
VALAGLRVDATERVVTHPARTSGRLGAWTISGLRLGEDTFDVGVGSDGRVVVTLPPGSPIRVVVEPAG